GVGTWIAEECAKRGKRVSLEMGGKNAIVVMDDADLQLAADAIAWASFGTTGQRCTACSRVIVHEKLHDALLAEVVKRAESLKVGSGLDDATQMGPVVNRKQLAKIESYIGVG